MTQRTRIAQRWVGQTDVAVSTLGFGTAPLGGLYKASSQDAACKAVRAALTGGITHFDTAPSYGFGLAEERLGLAIHRECPPETTTIVSSKVGRTLNEHTGEVAARNWVEPNGRTVVNDSSRDGIRRSVEATLKRTGLEKLDILFLHDPDKQAADGVALNALLAEAHKAMAELREEGVVAAIGIGVNSAEPCLRALKLGAWDCFMLAGSHSVLSQDDNGLLDACLKRQVSVMVAAPFLSGVLAGGDHWRYRPVPDDVRARVQLLNDLCRQHDVAVEAAALQFPLFHPAVCNVVVGMCSDTEVVQNLANFEATIPDELWQALHVNGFISESHFAHVTSAAA